MPPADRTLRILVVDDSPDFIRAACDWISLEEDVVVAGWAESGQAAIEAVDSLHPDVVLLDVSMPGMSGIEAASRIKSLPDPPVIALITLHDIAPLREFALDAGADEIVSKRNLDSALIETLRRLRDRDSLAPVESWDNHADANRHPRPRTSGRPRREPSE